MFYTISIVVIGILLVFLPSLSTFYNTKSFGKIKFTPVGIATIVLGILLIIFSVLQYKQIKKDERVKEEQAKIEQDDRDRNLQKRYDSSLLIMKLKFDTSNFKTTSIISENLGKYDYRFDSANNRIIKMIKDSSKTRIIIGDNPSIVLLSIKGTNGVQGIKGGENFVKLKIELISADAGSCCFNLTFSAVGMANDPSGKGLYGLYLWKDYPVEASQRIPKDNIQTSYSFVEINKYTLVYFWLRGTYKNADQTKIYQLDEGYFYNIANNSSGILKGESKAEIVTFISQKEKLGM